MILPERASVLLVVICMVGDVFLWSYLSRW